MKTLKTLSLLIALVCCSYWSNAQFLCGINQVYFYETTNPNQTFTFHDTTQLQANWQIIGWHWDFGDGSSSTLQAPQHHYSNNGVYTVCEVVSAYGNGVTCSDTFCKVITVSCTSITGNFTYSAGGFGLVTFATAFNSTYTPITYVWDFGDGSSGTGASPTHTYNIPGVYTVCVTATDANGCSKQVCSQVGTTSGICGSLHAAFNATTNGNVVALNSTSTGTNGNTLYQWSLDGQPVTNPNPNTAYTLTSVANGVHTICLYVYANANTLCDSTCQTITVGTSLCGNLQTSFSATNSSSGVVQLLSTSTNVPGGTWYQWWMDGSPVSVTSAGLNMFTVSNISNGTHLFCLYMYSAQNSQWLCDSSCQNVVVNNSNPCSGLSAQFTQTYVQNNGVQFFSANADSNAVYSWSFGDGQNSSQESPTHYYANSGLYTVCLIVHIAGTICADTVCHNVQANAGTPCSGFGVTISSQVNPNGGWYATANIVNGTPGANYYSAWSDGSTTNSIHVINSGVYCVTVTDANGCSATTCDSVPTQSGCNMVATITENNSGFYSVLTAYATNGVAPLSYYWSNGASTSNILTVTVSGTYCVTVYDNFQCSASYCHYVQVGGGSCTDTICGIVFEDTNGNGVLDGGEFPYSGGSIYVSGGGQTYVDSFGHYMVCVPTGTYNIYYCSPSGYSFTIPMGSPNNGNNCAVYQNIYIHGGGTHCGFDFGLQNQSTTICGTVYFDANNNHHYDTTETGIGNVVVLITGGGATYTGYTDQDGNYCVLVPAGTYTITVQSNIYSGVITPTVISVAATSTGTTYNHNDFGVYTQPGSCNLMISITPHTTVTAGFPAWYDIQVCNIGGNITSGTVNMFYDSHLTFSSASPIQTSQNSSTHTVTWAINNMLPGDCEYYWVDFDASPNTPIGQFIFTLANVLTTGCNDIDMSNNVDTIHQDATASWDPNNKLAYVTNHEADPNYQEVSSLNSNQRIEYVINFQNTGNSPAVNVVVLDLLSNDIDASSFELLGASHSMTATRSGADINFKFNSIMLADATTDEANSHGWVKFAVNAINGLVPGHVISDDAAIYFDYNAAVITNDAAVTLIDVTGIDEAIATATIVVAPNPMSQTALFKLSDTKATGFKLRVTDMTGRLVREEVANSNSMIFDRSNLTSGVYTYQVIQSNKLSAKGKLVVQ